MDLEKTPRGNDSLTIFVILLIRISIHPFTYHVGIESTTQKALDEYFSNCLMSVSVKGWNVSFMNMQDSPTNGIPWDKVTEGNPSCIFNIFWQTKLLKQWAISLSQLIILFTALKKPLISLGSFDLFIIIFWFRRDKGIFNLNVIDLEHFTMNMQTGPDPHPLTSSVSLCSLCILIVPWKQWSSWHFLCGRHTLDQIVMITGVDKI